MKRRASAVKFMAVTVLLVLVAAYFCAETVKCRVDVAAEELEIYYQEKEACLVKETREFLEEEGFPNSGVMLNKVVDTDGSRAYTLMVHHGKIDRMTEAERENLLKEMQQLVFVGDGVSFFHEFLLNQ